MAESKDTHADDPEPLLTAQSMRALALRTALIALVGSAGAVAGALVLDRALLAASLVGVWWGTILLPLSFVERRLARQPTRWGVALLVLSAASYFVTFVGALQWQYAAGVARGGSVEAGFQQVRRMLTQLEPLDFMVLGALCVPFVAGILARLATPRLGRQVAGALVLTGAAGLPVLTQAHQLPESLQVYACGMVLLAAAAVPLVASAAESLERRWPRAEH